MAKKPTKAQLRLDAIEKAARINRVTASSAAQLGHTHAASAITSGTLDDARISESSVTQHGQAIHAGGIHTASSAPGSPAEGDVYFDTTDKTLYTYDSTRAHWFGPLEWIDFGFSGTPSDGENMRSNFSQVIPNANRGYHPPYAATVVSLVGQTNNTFTGSMEIREGGSVTGTTLAFSSSDDEADLTVDHDLSTTLGIGAQINITSGSPTNPTLRIAYRRRKV